MDGCADSRIITPNVCTWNPYYHLVQARLDWSTTTHRITSLRRAGMAKGHGRVSRVPSGERCLKGPALSVLLPDGEANAYRSTAHHRWRQQQQARSATTDASSLSQSIGLGLYETGSSAHGHTIRPACLHCNVTEMNGEVHER